MSRAGDRPDDALAERFSSTLKAEIPEAQAWYNRQRRHSALNFIR